MEEKNEEIKKYEDYSIKFIKEENVKEEHEKLYRWSEDPKDGKKMIFKLSKNGNECMAVLLLTHFNQAKTEKSGDKEFFVEGVRKIIDKYYISEGSVSKERYFTYLGSGIWEEKSKNYFEDLSKVVEK